MSKVLKKKMINNICGLQKGKKDLMLVKIVPSLMNKEKNIGLKRKFTMMSTESSKVRATVEEYFVIIWSHQAFLRDTKYNKWMHCITASNPGRLPSWSSVWISAYCRSYPFFITLLSLAAYCISIPDPEHISKSHSTDHHGHLVDVD